MPMISDPKKEKFAQLLARGKGVTQAYTEAGWKANSGNASTMHKRDEIQKRVAEIIGERQTREQQDLDDWVENNGISQSYIINQILETGLAAKDAGQFSAAQKSFELLGKELFGMFNPKKEVSVETNVHIGATAAVQDFTALFAKLAGAADKLIIDTEFEDIDLIGEEVSREHGGNDRLLGYTGTDQDGSGPD